jgi:hypothetical protein
LQNFAIAYIMRMKRRNYRIPPIVFNGLIYDSVIIDSHYERKHKDQVNDELILELVKMLNRDFEEPTDIKDDYFYYTKVLFKKEKGYRLVWLTQKYETYVGIINAFRDSKGEKNAISK